MKTILLLHDAGPAYSAAATLAFAIAEHTGANLLLASAEGAGCALPVNDYVLSDSIADAGDGDTGGLLDELTLINENPNGYTPAIRLLPEPRVSLQELATLVRKENISMVIKGFGEGDVGANLDLRAILNRAVCPIMLVPGNYLVKSLERMVYVTDLRYGKPAVLRYLIPLAKGYHAELSVAHISANGLPHPVAAFASGLFHGGIRPQLQYDRLDYHLIKERDVRKAMDVLIHGMQTDLLVLENHQFHLEELFEFPAMQWAELSVPLLIFPG